MESRAMSPASTPFSASILMKDGSRSTLIAVSESRRTSAGAIFGGINTMFAAFIARRKELATLQAVGYTRIALVFSLFQEALLINLTGGLLAMTITQLFLADIHISFSTGVFHLVFDNSSLILGAITSLLLSIVGIIMPAWGCLKPTLVSSLRSA